MKRLFSAIALTLVSGSLDAGQYRIAWDGADMNGRRVSPGVYFYELRSGANRESKRLIWVR